jgi:hypothetical protein
MTTKPPSNSRALSTKVLHAALAALSSNGGSMQRLDVRKWVLSNTKFTDWELESSGADGPPRWWRFLGSATRLASRAGFMNKEKDTWTISEPGSAAFQQLNPEELDQAARDGCEEWKAKRDDNQDDDVDSNSQSGLGWTSAHIMHSGLGLLSRSPGQRCKVVQFFQRLPGLIPDDAQEALDTSSKDWAWEIGYRTFYRAVKAGWLTRIGGVWTLTPAGSAAVVEYPAAMDLWQAAKAMAGSDDSKAPLPYLGEVVNSGQLPQCLYSTQSSTVQQLVSQIEQGGLALPDIQRPFVWKNKKVRDLLDSMFRGFPFGFILTWRSPTESRTKQIGTGDKGTSVPHALVIDGQQRLTSLFAVMTGQAVLDENFNERHIKIAFHPIRGAFEVVDAAISKNPEWIHDVSNVFSNTMGAFAVLESYLSKLEKAREITDEHKQAAGQNIQRLVNLQNTPLGVLEIAQDADEEQVAEIFVRINSKGQNLKQADFILTLLAVFWEEGREQLEDFARSCKVPLADTGTSPFNRILRPGPDDLIRVVVAVSHRRAKLSAAYQVLRGKDSVSGRITAEARDKNLDVLGKAQDQVLAPGNWHEFLKTLEAAGYRSEKMIQSMNAALMSYAFFLIGRSDYGLSVQELRSIIGRWFTFVAITGRYSGSPESIMEEDLARLRGLKEGDGNGFKKALEAAMDSELTTDFWEFTLPARLESSNSRTLYTFFAAQCRLGAMALYSELQVSSLLSPERRSTRKDLEVHHLFPKAWLKANGVTSQREYNQVANQTLVEWSDNADIADRDPAEYAPIYEAKSNDSVRDAHALPADWWKLEYPEFLAQRRRMMAGVIRKAFEKMSR